MAQVKGPRLARLICLFLAFVGTIITGTPVLFGLEGYAIFLIILGGDITVVALALFLFFSI